MDWVLLALLVAAFAAWVTLHVALVAGLVARGPIWHAILALLIPPLAPWWGAHTGMKLRAGAWVGALGLYLVCLGAATL